MNHIADHIGLKLDLSFGTISFERNASGTYACVDVELDVGTDEAPDNKVMATLRLPVAPDTDTIVHTVDRCRRVLVGVLRSSTDYFEAVSPDKLLYRETSSL